MAFISSTSTNKEILLGLVGETARDGLGIVASDAAMTLKLGAFLSLSALVILALSFLRVLPIMIDPPKDNPAAYFGGLFFRRLLLAYYVGFLGLIWYIFFLLFLLFFLCAFSDCLIKVVAPFLSSGRNLRIWVEHHAFARELKLPITKAIREAKSHIVPVFMVFVVIFLILYGKNIDTFFHHLPFLMLSLIVSLGFIDLLSRYKQFEKQRFSAQSEFLLFGKVAIISSIIPLIYYCVSFPLLCHLVVIILNKGVSYSVASLDWAFDRYVYSFLYSRCDELITMGVPLEDFFAFEKVKEFLEKASVFTTVKLHESLMSSLLYVLPALWIFYLIGPLAISRKKKAFWEFTLPALITLALGELAIYYFEKAFIGPSKIFLLIMLFFVHVSVSYFCLKDERIINIRQLAGTIEINNDAAILDIIKVEQIPYIRVGNELMFNKEDILGYFLRHPTVLARIRDQDREISQKGRATDTTPNDDMGCVR